MKGSVVLVLGHGDRGLEGNGMRVYALLGLWMVRVMRFGVDGGDGECNSGGRLCYNGHGVHACTC